MNKKDLEEFLQEHFELYQKPESWFRKAVKLRNAASRLYVSLESDLSNYDAAISNARAKLESSGDTHAEIDCEEPDLMPVYLLHGYALENALKAILIYRNPGLIGTHKLSKTLMARARSYRASTRDFAVGSPSR
jgi:hypothetical protein